MSRKYVTYGDQTVTTSFKTALSLISTAAIRPRVYEFAFSWDAAADNMQRIQISRHTADNTGSSVTPEPLNTGDPVSLTTSSSNHTGEPTITANSFLLNIYAYQRAIYQIMLAPGYELIMPATANAGLVFGSYHASNTDDVFVQARFEE